MAARKSIPVEYLRQCFRELDGHLFWLERPRDHFSSLRAWRVWNARFSGKEAGSIQGRPKSPRYANRKRRWVVGVNNSGYLRAVIVWVLHNGTWPPANQDVDHENRDPLDDRISNLRIATRSQNNANSGFSRKNTSGYKGVSWDKTFSKWSAQTSVRNKTVHLGLFDDPREAYEAYMAAMRRLHGEFAFNGATRDTSD